MRKVCNTSYKQVLFKVNSKNKRETCNHSTNIGKVYNNIHKQFFYIQTVTQVQPIELVPRISKLLSN